MLQEEIEAHKKDWELSRLQALKAENEKASEDSDSDKEEILTMSREDAYNQVKSERKPQTVKTQNSKRPSRKKK